MVPHTWLLSNAHPAKGGTDLSKEKRNDPDPDPPG